MKLSEIDENNITNEIIKNVLFNVPKVNYEEADVLIIFGCHIKTLFDERLKHAINVIKCKKIGNIIISGGVGKKGDFNESEYMLKYLRDHGIDNIIVENESTNSEENVSYSVQILKNNNMLDKRIVLLSNEFHIRKLAMMFKSIVPLINLIFEYPSVSMFSYDSIISNENSRSIAVEQVIKLKRYAIDGMIEDEELMSFSNEIHKTMI